MSVSKNRNRLYILSKYKAIQTDPSRCSLSEIYMKLNTTYTKSRTIRHSISHREPPDQDTAHHHATIFHSSMNTNTVNTTSWINSRFLHILSILDSLLLILLNTKNPDQPKPIRTRLNFYYCLNLFAM